MTAKDNYYRQEDDVKITPEEATIDIYRDARAKLLGMQIGTPNMHAIYDILQPYHDNGTEDQKAAISEAWTRICQITEELSKTDQVLNGAESAIIAAEKLRKDAKNELDKLITAIETMDTGNKIVADLYNRIEDDQRNYFDDLDEREKSEGLETLISELGGRDYVTRRSVMARNALNEMKDPSALTEENKYWLWGYIRSIDGEDMPIQLEQITDNIGYYAERLLGIEDTAELAERVIEVVQNNQIMTPKQEEAYKAFLLTLTHVD